MIMPTVNWYKTGVETVVERNNVFTGWIAASIKMMLVTDNYVPSQAHTSKADVLAYEISGGDYTPGGLLLASKSITTSTNQVRLGALGVRWTDLPVPPRYGIIYDDTNTLDANKTLLGYMDLGTLRSNKLTIVWPSNGVLVLTVEDSVGFP